MTVLITLSEVGSDAGPTFNLYSSIYGLAFSSIVEGIDKTELEAGYEATVPDGTTKIKVTSVGVVCTNSEFATITVIPPNLPPGVQEFSITQGYTSSLIACQNYNANGGQSGGSGTPQVVYASPYFNNGDVVYNSNGTPFVGNPALFYVIINYINITPGLESTIQIDSTGHVVNFYPSACLTINV